MFSKMKVAFAATAAAGVLALAGASGASAATLDVGSINGGTVGSGSMAIDATAGTSRLVITGDEPVALECTTTYGTGSINTGSYGILPPASVTIGTIVPKFDDCLGPLGLDFVVDCKNEPGQPATMLNATGVPSAGTTSGTITNIYCELTFPLISCTAQVRGSVPVSYTNPTGSTDANLRVFAAGQNLTVSNSGCTAFIPNGAADYGAPGSGSTDVVNIDYTVTGPTGDQPLLTGT